MRAIQLTGYGAPDVLQMKSVDTPSPKEKQVVIKVIAASANPLDWHRMRGEPFLVRIDEGWRSPKEVRFGADVAGIVEAIGPDVTRFSVGDAVFGSIYAGSFAEYALANESMLAHKPVSIAFEDAAAVPVAGLTALQGLRDKCQLQAGQSLLINGASGGVGTYAVQLAKYYGADVTGVCSTRNLELVRSLGADHVIDYTQENFTTGDEKYDVIFDLISNHAVMAYKRALNPNGKAILAGFSSMAHILQVVTVGSWVTRTSDRHVGLMGTAKIDASDLEFLGDLLAQGEIKSVIDCRFSLDEAADAITYLETSRARGKVIINIQSEK